MTINTRKSDEFQWTENDEIFRFVTHAFDVKAAKALIRQRPRKVWMMNISGVSDLVGNPPVKGEPLMIRVLGVMIDWEKAQSDGVDLEFPCILVPWRDSQLPIDGWHRVAKAKVMGKTSIPCVILTKKELKQIQLA